MRAFVVIAALLTAVVGLQAVHERQTAAMGAVTANLLYVRSPEALGRMALSYDALLADLYWIRAVQHYGGTRLSTDPGKQYDLLYPLLDLTTSLDPRFHIAYTFGAIFLSELPPGGPGRSDLGIALLEKGLRAEPARWEYAYAIGFVHYWWGQEYDEAAAWFERAAALPNAPVWMRPLAATTLAQGGSREASRFLWQQIAATAEDEWFRNEANRRLLQLTAMDQMDQLRTAVDRYRQREGVAPGDWTALQRAGYLKGTPIDPAGEAYVLRDGVVALGPDSTLDPLPVDPRRRP